MISATSGRMRPSGALRSVSYLRHTVLLQLRRSPALRTKIAAERTVTQGYQDRNPRADTVAKSSKPCYIWDAMPTCASRAALWSIQ